MTAQRINRITFLLLLFGLGGALALYLMAKPVEVDPLLDDPLYNKKYLYELKRIGGEANVLSAEFQEWFAAQWRGVLLARTVAVLTVGATLAFRFVVTAPEQSTEAGEGTPPGPTKM
jgi:hypothetical protein